VVSTGVGLGLGENEGDGAGEAEELWVGLSAAAGSPAVSVSWLVVPAVAAAPITPPIISPIIKNPHLPRTKAPKSLRGRGAGPDDCGGGGGGGAGMSLMWALPTALNTPNAVRIKGPTTV
jgi:hypothetical protein